jgi:signal transduction histidine kinase
MGEETVRHAFEPFYTTKRAEENTGIGLGLGLSICRQILKNHKGEIAVRSEPGKGTTFSITLPVG